MNDYSFLFLHFEMSFAVSQSSVRSFSIPALFSKENALKVLHVVSLFSSCSLVCFFSEFSSLCMPLSSLAISFINCCFISVALVSRFFVLFGSFIKTQLNLDLSVQPALLL
jgi:hypothetical protein